MWRSVLATGATALLAASCSVSANALDGDGTELSLSAAPMAEIDPVTITVHDDGAEPRQLLADVPRTGTRQVIAITQAGRQHFDVAGEVLEAAGPTIRLAISLEVVEHTDRTASVAVAFTSADVLGVDGDPVVADQASALVRGVEGSVAHLSVLAGGTIDGPEPNLPNDDAGAGLVLGWYERAPISTADGLPAIPLGIGASWTVEGPVDGLGVAVRSARTYEITGITDTEINGIVHRRVTWPAGDHGGAAILTDSQLTGSGSVTWHRDGIVGIASFELNGSVGYDLGPGTLHQDITSSFDASTEVYAAPPPTTTTVPSPPTTAPSPPTTLPTPPDPTPTAP